jgi:predicted TIM-barrel fold metal-dependent hydrolase
MYIVDVHGHPPRKGSSLVPGPEFVFPRSVDEVDQRLIDDSDEMISAMDRYGITTRVLLAMPPDLDPLFHYDETDSSTGVRTFTSHEWIAQAVDRHPRRFVGFACLDPTLEGADRTLESVIAEYRFKGVKLHPCHHNFEVNDRTVYPFYEKCIEIGIPVAFHMGYDSARDIDRLKFQRPLLLDDVASDLPDLKIILCHCGGNWYQEGTLVALRNENVYVDISSMHEACSVIVYPEVEPAGVIKRIIELIGDDRVMYGTDNLEHQMNLFFILSLGLGNETNERLMGENASKLLELDVQT